MHLQKWAIDMVSDMEKSFQILNYMKDVLHIRTDRLAILSRNAPVMKVIDYDGVITAYYIEYNSDNTIKVLEPLNFQEDI